MGTPKDILVIEDDRDMVNLYNVILTSKQYLVRTASNSKEGYAKIQEKIPDLIILDVMMSTDTEGFDFAYKLKHNSQCKRIPIIMATSFQQKVAEEGPERFQHILGEEWPVSHFLEKPVDPEELLSIVDEIFRETET